MAGRKFDNETWLEFDYAVGEIERRLGLSKDAAKDRLRSSCRDGDVVSWGEPQEPQEDEYEHWTVIPQDVWEHHDVDCEAFDDGLGGEFTYYVRVSEADFEHWLKQQRVTKEAKKQALGKRPRIKAHLAKLYPEGVPDPAHCPRKELLRELLKIDPGLKPLDDQTLKSAIDEYNTDPK